MWDWKLFESSFGGAPKAVAAYRLFVDEEVIRIEFMADSPATLCPEAAPGAFFEGLWRYDCGELFLYSPSNGRYVEFNLSPNGAWWSCVFSAPRVRHIQCSPPEIETSSSVGEERWRAGFEVSLEEIYRCLGTVVDLRGNVTLVLGYSPDHDTPLTNLHTIAPLSAVNFHLPNDWVPIEKLH